MDVIICNQYWFSSCDLIQTGETTKSPNHPAYPARRLTDVEKTAPRSNDATIGGPCFRYQSHVQKQWRISFLSFFSGVGFLADCPCPHVLKDMKSSKWDQSKLSSPIFPVGKKKQILGSTTKFYFSGDPQTSTNPSSFA